MKAGGTHWCDSGAVPAGQRWASWGVGGLSMHYKTRELAGQFQGGAYRGGVP